MRKIIAAINMTIDGFCDHTILLPDEEIHDHYTDLLNAAGVILYGKTTYQLMEYWREFIEKPSGEKSMNDFAKAIDKIPKIVFSHTLANVDWHSATLADIPIEDVISELKQQPGKDVLVGSRSLINTLSEANLIDEYQLCVHPVMAGKGLPLFHDINNRTIFTLEKTKCFNAGAIILYYTQKN